MGLIDRLKSALGLGSASETRSDARAGRTGKVTPETDTEDAVKGTDTGGAGDSGGDAGHDDGGESTESIKGIGPTYSERLAAAGIETVAELAAADPEALAAETDISETRVRNWVERARAR